MRIISSFFLVLLLAGGSLFAQQNWEEMALLENIRIVQNKGGQTLGYAYVSGIKPITKDGFVFKYKNTFG